MGTPLVIVQRMSFEWGKESRGSEMAGRRTQAMRAALLPEGRRRSRLAALVQVLSYSDSDAFSQARERVYRYDRLVSARPAELEITLEGELLRLAPYTSHPLGQGKILELRVGQTARFEWNQKLVLEETWRYLHTRLNVGLTTQHPSARLFYTQPTFEERRLAQMY